MFPGLRHDAVVRRDEEDGAVHLRRPRYHVLDEVRVTGAVGVGVLARLRLVADMRDIYGNPPESKLRKLSPTIQRAALGQSQGLVRSLPESSTD